MLPGPSKFRARGQHRVGKKPLAGLHLAARRFLFGGPAETGGLRAGKGSERANPPGCAKPFGVIPATCFLRGLPLRFARLRFGKFRGLKTATAVGSSGGGTAFRQRGPGLRRAGDGAISNRPQARGISSAKNRVFRYRAKARGGPGGGITTSAVIKRPLSMGGTERDG